MTSGDVFTPQRCRSWAQEVRRESERGSKDAVTSRRSREDVIPVRFSLDFAVGRGPTFHQHARKAELSQGMCEEVQVAGKPGTRVGQAEQPFMRNGQQGAGAKADERSSYETEEGCDRTQPGGSRCHSHAANMCPQLEGSP